MDTVLRRKQTQWKCVSFNQAKLSWKSWENILLRHVLVKLITSNIRDVKFDVPALVILKGTARGIYNSCNMTIKLL